MVSESANRIWINGYIILGKSTRIPVQEISVDLSRDLKEQYNSGVTTPAALVPGQEKIEFKIKRIFSNTTMMKIYQKRCYFNMVLFNNSSEAASQSSPNRIIRIALRLVLAILKSAVKS